jgi:hypothetical protein
MGQETHIQTHTQVWHQKVLLAVTVLALLWNQFHVSFCFIWHIHTLVLHSH